MFEKLKYLFGGRNVLPIYLIFQVTSRCNQRCKHCFNWRYIGKSRDLTLEEIKKVSESLGKVMWLTIGGGEPTLRDDLADICEIFYQNNDVEILTIATNGLDTDKIINITKNVLKRCKELNLYVPLSFDGIGELHDEIRGKGSFNALMKTYSELEKIKKESSRLLITLTTVLSNKTLDHVEEMTKFVRQNMPAIDSHSFELLRGSVRDCLTPELNDWHGMTTQLRDGTFEPPTYEQLVKVYPIIRDYWLDFKSHHSKYSRLIRGAKIMARKVEIEVIHQKRQIIPCYAGRVSGVIDASGNVRLCEVLEPIGTLNDAEYDFKKIWFSEKANALRKDIKEAKCYCTHACHIQSSILFNPLMYPRILRNIS